MSKNKYEKIFKRPALLFFAGYFILSCFIFDDYGISWDEPFQRSLIGATNCHFIKTGDASELLDGIDKYHGPAVEILLYTAEKFSGITDTRHIYLLRHFLCFLIFFCCLICFYFLSLKIFKDPRWAILACSMLLFSPRIFAEVYYNSKDIPFLGFFIAGSYSMLLYLEKQSFIRAVIHGLCCGVLIDIRIIGILLPILTLVLWFLQSGIRKKTILAFIISCLCFIIIFWPVLWLNPVYHFISAFKQMSHYIWDGEVLYFGKFVSARELPWHYIPVWMCITTPIIFILFFISGIIFTLKNPLKNFRKNITFPAFLIAGLAPIVVIILLNAVVYDSWRHVFFVYPFFVLIAISGCMELSDVLKQKKLKYIPVALAWLGIVLSLGFIWKNHPFQNVYFNPLAGKNIRQNFELDYWGLSYRQGLEYILANDSSKHIIIQVENAPGVENMDILEIGDRKRIIYTGQQKEANYFLSNFRYHPADYTFGSSIYRIEVGNEKIMEVIQLKKQP
jgi:hypothetical protein